MFDRVVEDLAPLREDFSLGRLISQRIASADSICANIEEGYGRLSRKEYIRFLDFFVGSVRETRGRYLRMHHWLNAQTIQERIRLLMKSSASSLVRSKHEVRYPDDSTLSSQ